ncbi:hypothetical protein [Vibrio owensii]|uniref:hypothetical protein n=1 Tax=Vibrio owensii TaxID=696485 RepID=UPI003AACC005
MKRLLGLLVIAVALYYALSQQNNEERYQEQQKLATLIEELNKGQFTESETSEIKDIVHILFADNEYDGEKPSAVTTKGVQLLIKKLVDNETCASYIENILSSIELSGEFRSNFISAFLSQLTSTAREIVEKGNACQSATTIGNVTGIKFEFYGKSSK